MGKQQKCVAGNNNARRLADRGRVKWRLCSQQRIRGSEIFDLAEEQRTRGRSGANRAAEEREIERNINGRRR